MRSITSFSGRFFALRMMPPEIVGSRSMSIFAMRPSSIKTSFRGTCSVTEKEIILSPPIDGGGGLIISLEALGIGASACFAFSFFCFSSSLRFFISVFVISPRLRPVVRSIGSRRP